tara:strand:- start:304 stop:2385 length:2082 start_codon:yes stop_codon:yes gene_type:complete
MSFLTPLFLLGGLAIAGPILFHLLRRKSRERFTFSSLMFLRPEAPRLTKKSRLEDILLLLLRCTLLALLAFAFARPFFKELVIPDQDPDARQRTVLLIDVSASMQRNGLWTKAMAKAETVIEKTKSDGSLAILAFGDETKALLRFDQWNDLPEEKRPAVARETLGRLQPGWGGTHLGNAILTAAEILDETDAATRKRIVVLSDLQRGSRMDGLQGHEWPEGMELTMEPLAPDVIGNAGLSLAPARESNDGDTPLHVRVVNSEDATQEQFRLAWVKPDDSNMTGVTHLYLPAGKSRSVKAPRRPSGKDWCLALLGDDESFDDQLFIVPEAPEPIRIHYVGNEKPDDVEHMRFYLERAFSKTRLQHVEVLAHAPDALAGKLIHPDDRLLIVTEALPDAVIEEVRSFCESGHPVLLVLKNEGLASTLGVLAASGPVPVNEAKVNEYALLTRLDFEHPLFVPFKEPRFGDFTKIHFWKHRTIDSARLAGSRVLVRFDDDSPALIDLPIGRGHLLVLTSGWHPADSQLALSSKFVPLLYSMMDMGRIFSPFKATNLVGRPINVSTEHTASREVEGPAGTIRLSGTVDEFFAEQPGIYSLKGARNATFSVNLPPTESHTAPISEERLEGLALPLASRDMAQVALSQDRRQVLLDEQLEKRQEMWRWLIVGAILLAISETCLGGRTWRRSALVAQTEESV